MPIELQGYLNGSSHRIVVENGLIRELCPLINPSHPHGYIFPGFLDLQVNGFAGVDFNGPELTLESLETAARAMLATGVTRFLPTIITSALDDMCRQLFIISTSIEQSPLLRTMCPGIHVEGPFIHPEDGPRGAHPREHVRAPNIAEFDRLQDAASGRLKLLTLAPDQPGARALIEHAARQGVLVSVGHHRAGAEQIEAAIAAGARMCTHLGNGSDAHMPRLDNPIWCQLGEDRLWASFITDGHHLPPPVIKGMLRAKGLDRSILVTDAIAAAGMPPGRYRIGPVHAERTDAGKVVLPGTPYLAGSGADMPQCITHAVQDGGLTLEQAVKLAALNPAHLLLGEPLDWRPAVGSVANLVELESNPADSSPIVRQVVAGIHTHTPKPSRI